MKAEFGDSILASVGLATNRLLAKVASDMVKPDGLTIIEEKDLPQKLMSLKLRDFPGIGAQMEKRLLKAGIYNTQILLNASRNELRQVWGGIVGEHFYEWLRGRDTDPGTTRQRSISHSHVLPPELRNKEDCFRALQKLLHKAAFRLRKDGMWCRRMDLYISMMEQAPEGGRSSAPFASVHPQHRNNLTLENSVRLIECQDDFSLMEALKLMFNHLQRPEIWVEGIKPLKVAVWLNDLVPDAEHNLSLFDNDKGLKVSQSLDAINAKFGRGSIYFANMGQSGALAPTRIAFQSTPEFDSD